MMLTTGEPAAWHLPHFAPAVEVMPGERRCAHINEHGLRCMEVYRGGRGTHKHCVKHRADYVPPPVTKACKGCGKQVPSKSHNWCRECRFETRDCLECGHSFTREKRKIGMYCSRRCQVTAVNRAQRNG